MGLHLYNLYYYSDSSSSKYWAVQMDGELGEVVTRWGKAPTKKLASSSSRSGNRFHVIDSKTAKGYEDWGNVWIDEEGNMFCDSEGRFEFDNIRNSGISERTKPATNEIYWEWDIANFDQKEVQAEINHWHSKLLLNYSEHDLDDQDDKQAVFNFIDSAKEVFDVDKRHLNLVIPKTDGIISVLFLLSLKNHIKSKPLKNNFVLFYEDDTEVSFSENKRDTLLKHFGVTFDDVKQVAVVFGLVKPEIKLFSQPVNEIKNDWF